MLNQIRCIVWFGQHVSTLIFGPYCQYGYLSIGDKQSEVMVLVVDVLGSGPHYGCVGKFHGSTVVLKQGTLVSWGSIANIVAQFLHLLHYLH